MPLRLIAAMLALISLLAPIAGARAQAIVLRADEVLGQLRSAPGAEDRFFVNGLATEGLDGSAATDMVPLGEITHLMIALAAVRMADEGVLDLKAPVAPKLPDVLEDEPFTVKINALHLLSETAGFATPPEETYWLDDRHAPLSSYAIPMRTAGQFSTPDPIGWAVLARLMAQADDTDIETILVRRVLVPLGVAPDALSVAGQDWQAIEGAEGTRALVAELARVLVRNRDKGGAPFLSAQSYGLLTDARALQIHPLAPIRSFGVWRFAEGGHVWLEAASSRCPLNQIMAFPHEDAAFIALGLGDCVQAKIFRRTVDTIADLNFPPKDLADSMAATNALARPDGLSGRYVWAENTPAGVADRLALMRATSLVVTPAGDGKIRATYQNGMVFITDDYTEVAPYAYENAHGAALLFSPYRHGGYALLGGVPYRRVDIIGNPKYVWQPLPWVILVLLTAIVHVRNPTQKAWRNMALCGFFGALLVAIGLFLELRYWTSVLYEADRPWLVTLWRTMLNIGLMLVLTLPLFTMSFRKPERLPKSGLALILSPPHMAILGLAAAALLLILIALGLAGSFSAY